jgi:hypothetical protein
MNGASRWLDANPMIGDKAAPRAAVSRTAFLNMSFESLEDH